MKPDLSIGFWVQGSEVEKFPPLGRFLMVPLNGEP
jgi:hypothetical protein